MRFVRAVWRLLWLLLHIAVGVYIVRWRFPGLSASARQATVRDWTRQALRIMGVRLQVLCEPPVAGPLLVLANHISWLDILLINASQPCRFISKSEVRHWPVIGRLAVGAGTLFIERQKRSDALRVAQQTAAALRDGDLIALFPEGTTGDGQGIMPFHASLLQSALEADCPILPVGLVYLQGDGQALLGEAPRHDAAVYIGKANLLTSVWRIVSASDLQAVVHWGEPDTAQGRDRRAWADSLRAEIGRLANQPLLPRTGEPPRWKKTPEKTSEKTV
ncbi:MAG: lysophospholipid acyltransferase family protein [Serpentinimonas sp.]|nr:lysophospholipid acyltransferase family protein [Serpentinimonas sp.]